MLFTLWLFMCPVDADGWCKLSIFPGIVSEAKCNELADDLDALARENGFNGMGISICQPQENNNGQDV